MNRLINRNKNTTFESLFIQLATNHMSKLSFTTKEEYLSWVKQWKEDYKIMNTEYRRKQTEGKISICRLDERIAYFKKKLKSIPRLTNEEAIRLASIHERFRTEYGSFGGGPLLIWYMLIVRKAGKLKAKSQMALRSQELVNSK